MIRILYERFLSVGKTIAGIRNITLKGYKAYEYCAVIRRFGKETLALIQ